MSELDLTARFEKTFFFNSHKKHLARLLALPATQQEAVVVLLERNMPATDAFEAVEAADNDSLLLRFDETIERLHMDYLASTTI